MEENENKEKIVGETEDEQDLPEKRDYEEELLNIIKSDEPPQQIAEKLEDYHENDIAAILSKLTKAERIKLYKLLGVEKVSEIFAYLDDVEEYIDELDSEKQPTLSKAWTPTTRSTFSTNWKTKRKKRSSSSWKRNRSKTFS